MQSEYIFGAESEGAIFDNDHTEAATQIAAAPQAGTTIETPLLPLDAAQVVLAPGQTVIRVVVTPGEVVVLPFAPDAQFLARLGDGNLAIKVGDVTVILQGYQAGGDNPPVLQASDGSPIDIATLLAQTDPNIDIQTAAGPGDTGGQGADNTGAFFQQLGGGAGLGGFQGVGSQDDTSGPDGGDGPGTNQILLALTDDPVNLAPTVTDVAETTDEDSPFKGKLTGIDPEGGPLTFVAEGTPPNGVILNPDGTWSFDPTGAYDYLAAGEQATVTFQYKANDGAQDSNVGTVTLTIDGVNDAASMAGDETGSVKEDVTAIATGKFTVSDLDHDQSHTQAETDIASTYGKWSVDADGTWTYTLDNTNPAVNALPEGGKLTDSFTVTSLDGTATETVTITINGTNDKPTITGNAAGDVTEDKDLFDSGKLTFTDPDTGQNGTQAQLVGAASHGLWNVDKNGNWKYLLNDLDPAVQALHAGETLTDTFTVKSKDGTATQDVTITIHGTDDKAFMFGDTKGKATEDSGTTATGTLNVIDLDHDQSGTQSVTNAASANGYGTWSVDASGHWSYKLDDSNATVNALPQGTKLTDSFTVSSIDGSAAKTVTITITGANDGASITGDNTGAVTEDLAGSVGGTVTVTDVDTGEAHTKTATNLASDHGYGTWSVDADGHWSYTLDNGNPTVNALPQGGKLTDTFTVTSLDGTASEVITVAITGHNDQAIITGTNTGSVTEDNGVAATGKLTVTDPDQGQAHTQVATDVAATYGTWSVDADGHWSYKLDNTNPAVNALGTSGKLFDSFIVTSLDGSDSRVVTITINGHNDAPVVIDGILPHLDEQTVGSTSLVATASDAETPAANLIYSAVGALPTGITLGADGKINVSFAGNYDYLAAGESKDFTFQFKASDGEAFSNVGTVYGKIHGVNDAPVIDSNGGTGSAKISIAENTTAVTTVHAADVDAGAVVTYSISGADAALFSIDSVTGALSFKNAPDFENPADSGKDNVYDLTVKADDGNGGSDTQAIAVTVTDVVEVVPTKAADDYIFTTETGAFWVADAWLLANDKGSALKIDDVDANGNEAYFDPIVSIIPPFFFPTPLQFDNKVHIDLDTTKGLFETTYLKNNEHTSFEYTAKAGAATDTANVEVTYVVGTKIDRTGDNHDVIIVGSNTNEQLTGGNGNDFIRGGGGDDRIFGGACVDSIYGEDGNDVMQYSTGDNIHGGDDTVGKHNDLSGDNDDRGDVLAFGQSIDLTKAEFAGQFDGIETVSLKNGEAGGSGAQALTINASNVNAMSDHTVTPGGVFSEERAVRIDMDAVDQLYLSISKDGGTWSNTGKSAGGYDIFVHDTSGAAGSHENAYVLVAHANVGNVHLNQDAPAV